MDAMKRVSPVFVTSRMDLHRNCLHRETSEKTSGDRESQEPAHKNNLVGCRETPVRGPKTTLGERNREEMTVEWARRRAAASPPHHPNFCEADRLDVENVVQPEFSPTWPANRSGDRTQLKGQSDPDLRGLETRLDGLHCSTAPNRVGAPLQAEALQQLLHRRILLSPHPGRPIRAEPSYSSSSFTKQYYTNAGGVSSRSGGASPPPTGASEEGFRHGDGLMGRHVMPHRRYPGNPRLTSGGLRLGGSGCGGSPLPVSPQQMMQSNRDQLLAEQLAGLDPEKRRLVELGLPRVCNEVFLCMLKHINFFQAHRYPLVAGKHSTQPTDFLLPAKQILPVVYPPVDWEWKMSAGKSNLDSLDDSCEEELERLVRYVLLKSDHSSPLLNDLHVLLNQMAQLPSTSKNILPLSYLVLMSSLPGVYGAGLSRSNEASSVLTCFHDLVVSDVILHSPSDRANV